MGYVAIMSNRWDRRKVFSREVFIDLQDIVEEQMEIDGFSKDEHDEVEIWDGETGELYGCYDEHLGWKNYGRRASLSREIPFDIVRDKIPTDVMENECRYWLETEGFEILAVIADDGEIELYGNTDQGGGGRDLDLPSREEVSQACQGQEGKRVRLVSKLIDVWNRDPQYDWPWWDCAIHILHPEECDAHGWYWGDLHELFDHHGSTLVRGCEHCDTVTAGRIERTPGGEWQRRLWVITDDHAEYLGLGPKPFGGGRGISVKNERMLWYFEDLTNDRLGWTPEEEVALLREYIEIFYDKKPENSISFALAAAVKDVRKRGWKNVDDVWHHAGELIREGSPHPEVQALVDERWRRKNAKAAE